MARSVETESEIMKQINYYIISTIAATMGLAIVGLVGILSVFSLLDQIEDLRNNYTIFAAMLFVLYSVPSIFCDVIPYAALIGCLAGLGMMASSSELIVMRAAGISTWAICWNAMKPALLLVVVSLYLGEYILPSIEKSARVAREQAMSSNGKMSTEFGFWYREATVYMHFGEVTQTGVINGVSHYFYDENNDLTRSLFAERAVFHDVRQTEQYWLLEDVSVSHIGDDGVQVSKFASQRWETDLTPELISSEVLVKPEKMSIAELNVKIDYMQEQGLNSGKFELGFWRKVLQPFATIALVFVAISFVFGPLREATMGMRVISGLVIGIMFKFFQDLLSPASLVFGFEPIIAILLPIVVCAVAGYILLRRAG